MRRLLLFVWVVSLAGQEPEKKAAGQPEKKAEEAPAAEAASPSPVVEQRFSGSVDFGYRWVGNVGGNPDAYRSVVDLGDGPRLFGLDLSLVDPSQRLFDRVDILAAGWGGEPYSTARLNAQKSGLYRFTADYRNLAYFNFLPSFADPTLERGLLLNQRSFDTHRRYTDLNLELWPGRRVVPYVGYTRDSGFGSGITTFVANGNEYPVFNRLRDHTDSYRGGVRLERNRFHATLELGGAAFKDDQSASQDQRILGNRTTPLGGQDLVLNSLLQAYGIRGDSLYTRALVTAAPASWADFQGMFLFSQPSTDVRYSMNAAGLFVLPATLRFFTSQQDTLFASAKQPHTSGSLSLELRPLRRLRIVESWMTDRLHNASGAALAEQIFFSPSPGSSLSDLAADRLIYNHSRQQVDVFFDVLKRLTLHGGHRYVWGDAQVRRGGLDPQAGLEPGELRQQVGLAGFQFRAGSKLLAGADLEAGSADRSYFRTSLYDYRRLRARARYQLRPSMLFSANFALLDNQNPTRGVQYDFLSRSNSFTFQWMPKGGKYFTWLSEYTRSTLRSELSFLSPESLSPTRSLYRDNAHVFSSLLDINLPRFQNAAPRITLGGSLFRSSGSRPSDYYQPIGRALIPVHNHVQWFAEWRWYGYTEPFYLYEGFRAHMFSTGLRLTL